MRIYKLFGALLAVLAFNAIATAVTASAAETLWPWLPGSVGETFKGEQKGGGTLQIKGSGSITCTGATILLTLEKEGKKIQQRTDRRRLGRKKTRNLMVSVDPLQRLQSVGPSGQLVKR